MHDVTLTSKTKRKSECLVAFNYFRARYDQSLIVIKIIDNSNC